VGLTCLGVNTAANYVTGNFVQSVPQKESNLISRGNASGMCAFFCIAAYVSLPIDATFPVWIASISGKGWMQSAKCWKLRKMLSLLKNNFELSQLKRKKRKKK
jgi:hypothetical protein